MPPAVADLKVGLGSAGASPSQILLLPGQAAGRRFYSTSSSAERTTTVAYAGRTGLGSAGASPSQILCPPGQAAGRRFYTYIRFSGAYHHGCIRRTHSD
jgi:hypothetical protein